MTAHADLERLARRLRDAAQARRAIPPITVAEPELTVVDAYRIQSINIALSVAEGASVVGHKIGLTSAPMQEMMGVDEPDFGQLLDTMQLERGEPIALDAFIQPRIEPEIAFTFREDLPTSGCTSDDVLAATAAIAPCLELIDSRIEEWRIGLVDTIGDNASSAAFVVGEWRPVAPTYAELGVELLINDDVEEIGNTGEVLGDPAAAVAWLANTLGALGTVIEAGQIVLSGSATRARDVRPGDRVTAVFAGFGDVAVEFARKSGA